jgi:hypothetical protein
MCVALPMTQERRMLQPYLNQITLRKLQVVEDRTGSGNSPSMQRVTFRGFL